MKKNFKNKKINKKFFTFAIYKWKKCGTIYCIKKYEEVKNKNMEVI